MYDEHTEMARNCNVINDHQALPRKIVPEGGLNGYKLSMVSPELTRSQRRHDQTPILGLVCYIL